MKGKKNVKRKKEDNNREYNSRGYMIIEENPREEKKREGKQHI